MSHPNPRFEKLYEYVSKKDPKQEFKVLSHIGSGTYGDVYKAYRYSDQAEAAIKVVRIDPKDDFLSVLHEIQLLRECQHRNIVRYFDSYIRHNKLWICMEFCGGSSVQDIYTNTRTAFDEDCIAFVSREALMGLTYMHQLRQVHRDIKGANILLTERGHVKLADFGVAAKMSHTLQKRNSFIGTPYWMAPEVCAVDRKGGYDAKCDVWSIGITAIECAELQPPFFELPPMKALTLIASRNFKPPSLQSRSKWSSRFHSFVKQCLTKNEKRRPSAEQMLSHDFVIQSNLTENLTLRLINRNRIAHNLPPLPFNIVDPKKNHRTDGQTSSSIDSTDHPSAGNAKRTTPPEPQMKKSSSQVVITLVSDTSMRDSGVSVSEKSTLRQQPPDRIKSIRRVSRGPSVLETSSFTIKPTKQDEPDDDDNFSARSISEDDFQDVNKSQSEMLSESSGSGHEKGHQPLSIESRLSPEKSSEISGNGSPYPNRNPVSKLMPRNGGPIIEIIHEKSNSGVDSTEGNASSGNNYLGGRAARYKPSAAPPVSSRAAAPASNHIRRNPFMEQHSRSSGVVYPLKKLSSSVEDLSRIGRSDEFSPQTPEVTPKGKHRRPSMGGEFSQMEVKPWAPPRVSAPISANPSSRRASNFAMERDAAPHKPPPKPERQSNKSRPQSVFYENIDVPPPEYSKQQQPPLPQRQIPSPGVVISRRLPLNDKKTSPPSDASSPIKIVFQDNSEKTAWAVRNLPRVDSNMSSGSHEQSAAESGAGALDVYHNNNSSSSSHSPPNSSDVTRKAGFSLIFEGCNLKITCSASWRNPDTKSQMILFGCNEGVYTLNLQQTHENQMELLIPKRCTWLYVISNTLVALAGKYPQLYVYNLITLTRMRAQRYSVNSNKLKHISKLVPKRFSAASVIKDTRGCHKVKTVRNPHSGQIYLCAALPKQILLLEWYAPSYTFIEMRRVDVPFLPNNLLPFDLIVLRDQNFPLVCLGVYDTPNPKQYQLFLIDLNCTSTNWFVPPNGFENLLSVIKVTQMEYNSFLICFRDCARIVNLNGHLIKSHSFIFTAPVESIVCLKSNILAFHSHGLIDMNFRGQVTQDISDPYHIYTLIGHDRNIVVESRPADDPSSYSNIYILAGAV